MLIRLGYVANALRLTDCSPSKTITLQNILKIPDQADRIGRLQRIARQNLQNTLRILKANYYDRIMVYRFTSKLVPLATHPLFCDWDYSSDLAPEFAAIGRFIRDNALRVSLHPDHFTLLNSAKPEVLAASIRDLEYHLNVLEAMGLETESKLVIHVGGKYNDPVASLARFKEQFSALPEKIRNSLVLENDDRCFSAKEVLALCRELTLPMVFDLHHHQLLNNGETWAELLPQTFATWRHLRPKIHFSSPRPSSNPRYHADYIEVQAMVGFLETMRGVNQDCDIMLEAKEKDLALLTLVAALRNLDYQLPDNGSILL